MYEMYTILYFQQYAGFLVSVHLKIAVVMHWIDGRKSFSTFFLFDSSSKVFLSFFTFTLLSNSTPSFITPTFSLVSQNVGSLFCCQEEGLLRSPIIQKKLHHHHFHRVLHTKSPSFYTFFSYLMLIFIL